LHLPPPSEFAGAFYAESEVTVFLGGIGKGRPPSATIFLGGTGNGLPPSATILGGIGRGRPPSAEKITVLEAIAARKITVQITNKIFTKRISSS
jgi:hypothetical protein